MKNMIKYQFQSIVMVMACDRGLLTVGLIDGNIEIREIISGDRVRGWKGHDDIVRALVFTSDGRLVSGSEDGFVKKWDVETGTEESAPLERWSRNVGIGWVLGVAELADGRLVVGGEDMSVRVLDGTTGHEVLACRGHTNIVRVVISLGVLHGVKKGFQPAFASGSDDSTIRVWTLSPVGGTLSPVGGTLSPVGGTLSPVVGGTLSPVIGTNDGTLVRVVEVGEWVFSLSLSLCGHFAVLENF